MKAILLLALLFTAVICESAPIKAGTQYDLEKANFAAEKAKEMAEQATPSAEVISGDAQSDLIATGEYLDAAKSAASETVEVPVGLSESEAKDLTTIGEVAKSVISKAENIDGGTKRALNPQQEHSLIAAELKARMLVDNENNPSSTPVPTIPAKVSTGLARAIVGSKSFNSEPPKKKEAAPNSSAVLASRKIIADVTGAGDTASARPIRRRRPGLSKNISDALHRVNKQFSRANDIEIKMFDQNKEFNKLAKRMKSVQTALERIPTAEEAQKKAQNKVNARNNVTKALTPRKATVAPLTDLTHEAVTSAKVRVMLDFVRDLDELGRFFGEDELVDEDDTLSIVEDPKINIANSNFAAAVERIKSDLKANPNPFKPDHHLRDIGHVLENPVPISHAAPTDETDNLTYLRNLRNYVVSLLENEKNRA